MFAVNNKQLVRKLKGAYSGTTKKSVVQNETKQIMIREITNEVCLFRVRAVG